MSELSFSATSVSMSKTVQKNLGPSYPDISLLKDSTSLGKDVKLQLLTDKWKDVHTFKFPTRYINSISIKKIYNALRGTNRAAGVVNPRFLFR